jgi:hypothetical protein
MTIHILRRAFHAESIEDFAEWQAERRKEMKANGQKPRTRTMLRAFPTRKEELLDGGSIYWIIKGAIRARQRVLAVEQNPDPSSRRKCMIVLESKLTPTVPYPVRARRGWRYLEPNAVPPDLDKAGRGVDKLPANLAAELRELGLL